MLAAAMAVCASPLFLLLGSIDWFLTPLEFIDPWHYVGFFHHYANPDYSPGAYKLGRLPWVLAGWLVHRVTSGVAAALLLHALFLIASTSGMFVLVRQLFGSYRLALVAAAVIGFHPPFHGSGGWDYHNTAAGAIYIWALVSVTYAARAGGWWRDFLAGVAAAAAVHANITYVNFVPLLAVHFLVLARLATGRWPGWQRVLATGSAGLTGALAITGALSAINLLVGREALFFAAVVRFAVTFASDTSTLATYWRPWSSGWFWQRHHLALPTAVLLIAPFVLLSRSAQARADVRLVERLVLGEFAVMAAIWTAWQSAGSITLDWNYFAFPLLPHVLLAFAAVISARAAVIPWVLAALTPLIIGVPLALGLRMYLPAQPTALAAAPAVLPAVLFMLAGAVLWSHSRGRTTACILLFSLGNLFTAAEPQLYSGAGPCHIRADSYRAIVSANQWLMARDSGFRTTRLWFDEREAVTTGDGCRVRIADVGYALAGGGVPYFGNAFPTPAATDLPDGLFSLGANEATTVAVVSADGNGASALLQRAAAARVVASPLAARQFAIDDVTLTVSLLQLDQDPEPARLIAQLPGEVVGDWTTESLIEQLNVNGYDPSDTDVIERGATGELLFEPSTERDHLALPFVALPAATVERTLLVAAEPDGEGTVNCTAFVQDQTFNNLAAIRCGDPKIAMRDFVVPVPPQVTGVRVYFLSSDKRPMTLPSRLRVTRHVGTRQPPQGPSSPVPQATVP